ncbi:MAG: hypothetical protein RLZ51_833 [Pseudomonadota bacterium]|jgi:NADPH-dependent 2,4-dienoyl-CoA reductase/sulfur reductase-like enzyme
MTVDGETMTPRESTALGDRIQPRDCDLLIVGAGPAGMAAAVQAKALGMSVIVLDEQPRSGGQIWRDAGQVSPEMLQLLGVDYALGRDAVTALRASGAEVIHDCLVWDIDRDRTVSALHAERVMQFRPRELLLATGAMERPSPVPGWTLPGVMNAGAAQIALKTAGLVPQGRVVLAGCGPLLLLLAVQLARAGVKDLTVVETTEAGAGRRALRHLPEALRHPKLLLKGLSLLASLRLHGVRHIRRASQLRVMGQGRAEALQFMAGGQSQTLAADTVLLHHGVLPNTQLTRLLRLAHRWDTGQQAWHVEADAFGLTGLAGIRVAGDGTSIAGARAAELRGAIVALASARALGVLDAHRFEEGLKPLRRELDRELAARPFLDTLYAPPQWITQPADEVIVCRCEEVSAGRIREMALLGCEGPNQTKFFSRCGMGPCQGRICGTVVTQLLAEALDRSPQEVGAYRIRAPIKPIPLRALASLAQDDAN